MALPVYVAQGTTVGAGIAISPEWPAGHEVGDIAIVPVQTSNQTPGNNPPSGWEEVPSSPQGTGTAAAAGSTRLTSYWRRAESTSESAIDLGDSGDHQIGQILTYRGCIASGSPFDVSAGDVEASATTAVSVPGGTTTGPDRLITLMVAHGVDGGANQFSGWANADLANITERTDRGTSASNGGGFAVTTAEKATAGTFGATTATLANASVQGRLMLALKPPATAITVEPGVGELTLTGFAPTIVGGPEELIDTFTDTASTAIDSHVGDFGLTWSRSQWDEAGTAPIITAAGRLRATQNGEEGSGWKASVAPSGADYRITAHLYFAEEHDDHENLFELIARLDNSTGDAISAGYDLHGTAPLTPSWYVTENGVVLARIEEAIVAEQTYEVVLEVVGTTARLLVDGVEKLSATVAGTDPGEVAIYWYVGSGTPGDTTGIHLDQITMEPINDTVAQPGLGELVLTGFAPTVQLPVAVRPGVGDLTLTGHAPTVRAPRVVTPGVGELTVTGFAPGVAVGVRVSPGVGELTVTGFAPTIIAPRTVAPGAGELTLNGLAPTVSTPVVVRPGVGALTVAGFTPTVLTPVVARPGVGVLAIAGYEPTVLTPVVSRPGVGVVAIEGFAPTVLTPIVVRPGAGALEITGFAPAARIAHYVRPGLAELLVASFVPVVVIAAVPTPQGLIRSGPQYHGLAESGPTHHGLADSGPSLRGRR